MGTLGPDRAVGRKPLSLTDIIAVAQELREKAARVEAMTLGCADRITGAQPTPQDTQPDGYGGGGQLQELRLQLTLIDGFLSDALQNAERLETI